MRKIDRNKFKPLTSSEWQALSDEWEHSELTQLKFCKLKNLPLKTFTNQRQKVLQEKKKAQNQFLPAHINFKAKAVELPATQSVVLKLPNGICLQIALNTDKAWLRNVFELLGITPC
ncbi:hypothetical protein KKG71_03270 [Patescibacteria group bacterium]|nr:hypothetical protein [Patescibacteria group bacterium]